MTKNIIPLEDYFPFCILPECNIATDHSHILHHQLDIMDFGLNDEHVSVKKYLYCQGGVGSAKSVAFAARLVREMIEVKDNVGVVIRRDWDKLFKTCWLDVKKCITRLVKLGHIPKPHFAKKRQGDYTEITFHNASILYAVQGKNWTEGLGASYGVFWCDDAMELPELLFTGDEVSAGLVSRLRLPEARFFIGEDNRVNRLIGLMSTNPPPINNFLHKLFGKEPGVYKLGNDTVKHMQVSTSANPFVGADYAVGLMAIQQKMNDTGRINVKQNIERVVFGKSIPSYGGIPVYPQFNHATHVGDYKYDKKHPVLCSIDFGVDHPAVVFSNISKCAYGTHHYISLSEIADCFSLTIYTLYDDHIKPHVDKMYKDAFMLYAGDKAAFRNMSNRKDGRSDMKILIQEYNLSFKRRYFDLIESIKYMRALLQPKKPCFCGTPHILISNNCPVLIGAIEGGYRFTKNKTTGLISEKPYKDHYFDDIADAWRYGAENYVKWGVGQVEQEEIQEQQQLQALITGRDLKPWDWMTGIGGMNDQDLAKLLRT